jgi:hypothetical protein
MSSALPFEQPVLPIFETGQLDYLPAAAGESLSPYARPELARRVTWLQDNHDFLPTSVGETNEAYSIINPATGYHDALTHLERIVGHQAKGIAKAPDDAVRVVTREYAEYAWKARVDGWQLRTLGKDLAERGGHDGQSLHDADPLNGVSQLIRYYDLSRLAQEGTVAIEPFVRAESRERSALDPYTSSRPTKDMQAHLTGMAKIITVGRAKQLTEVAVTDQQAREAFWVERLREARGHKIARPIATTALARMKIEL